MLLPIFGIIVVAIVMFITGYYTRGSDNEVRSKEERNTD